MKLRGCTFGNTETCDRLADGFNQAGDRYMASKFLNTLNIYTAGLEDIQDIASRTMRDCILDMYHAHYVEIFRARFGNFFADARMDMHLVDMLAEERWRHAKAISKEC